MKKILIGLGIVLAVFLILPILVMLFCPAHEAMGLYMLLFFAINPLASVIVGVISGFNVKNMWWLPLVLALVFPLFHALALWISPVWELYIYSAVYAAVGYISMLISHILKRKK